MPVPPEIQRYCRQLLAALRDMLGPRLVALYGVGGLAFGDLATDSDVDVYAVVDGPLGPGLARVIAGRCSHRRLPCPARKLELVVISAEAAARPGPAPRWELNLNTGAEGPDHVGLDAAAEPSHWFVVDLALARQCACILFGPPPSDLIGDPDPASLRRAQNEVIAWYDGHGLREEAALAGARARHWEATGRFASKAEAALWARRHDDAAGESMRRPCTASSDSSGPTHRRSCC